MCRIFFNPSKSVTYEPKSLHNFFCELEKHGGGDGNGVYSFKTEELIRLVEKVPFLEKPDGTILFHTRKATNGDVAKYNCQPFVGDKYIMVHNGIFSGVESYARLLGFYFSSVKYSDSRMMHWILEKVGILNFYNAFKNEGYGVVLVYDKISKQMFLLKTCGLFSCAKLKSNGKYIYGTSKLDFWQIEGKINYFASGLYKLEENKITLINRTPTTVTYYGKSSANTYKDEDWYQKYRNKRWDNTNKRWVDKYPSTTTTSTKELCDYCGLMFPENDEHHIDHGYEICSSCKLQYVSDEEPTGISALFGNKVPSECNNCNWLSGGKCWFGGIERDEFKTVLDVDGEKIICNTKDDYMDMVIECEICEKSLKNTDIWGIGKTGLITCQTCLERIITIERYLETKKQAKIKETRISCATCHFWNGKMKYEPCNSCVNKETGEYDNWIEPMEELISATPDNDCDNCLSEKLSSYDEPCNTCRQNENAYYSEWKPKIDETLEKCWYCGYHFEEMEDEPLYDKKGHRICWDCDEFGEGVQYITKGGRF